MSARTHSTRILAIVALFFSSYIVGIYSAARASLQLTPLNATRSENSSLDALDATLSSERSLAHSSSRNPRWFPFYTIGRFSNDICLGNNLLMGTCMINGECKDNNGVAAGSCSTITNQAVCCIYQRTCGASTSFNNTYFYNSNYPAPYAGGGRCTIVVTPPDSTICQLRIDFMSLSLAPPTGDGLCTTDALTISGGASQVPTICGENSGQHVYVDFNGVSPITISVATSSGYTFNRNWQFQLRMMGCTSSTLAPAGCLQYHMPSSGNIASFNYVSAASSALNSIGVQGTRQLAGLRYGICIRKATGVCSITYRQVGSDAYSFTMTNDVGAVDPTLLATSAVQSQDCTTDYIIIPAPTQGGTTLPSDRFCGLGLVPTTSDAKPFVVYAVTDSNEELDISNRGFYLSYSQNPCPVL
ncbi:hypothetical protein AWZ03_000610 [Drosophila navojoa]|uniref:CUB domain-containing protein n=1 Tax=Drosophila navojoa TaxID=7232 RepID=A0A484BW58_DRONA|nr:uncharacterized protein LOC108650430 [Drosophila navojoa]XP_017955056.1 uncharacterized protein LOC108650430 [Drosophila navojoa]TDG53067.1 hypothetical protein AWZ03_000610 [Drosophila navojoa]